MTPRERLVERVALLIAQAANVGRWWDMKPAARDLIRSLDLVVAPPDPESRLRRLAMWAFGFRSPLLHADGRVETLRWAWTGRIDDGRKVRDVSDPLHVLARLRAEARRSGASEMTDAEIDEVIQQVRDERRGKP